MGSFGREWGRWRSGVGGEMGSFGRKGGGGVWVGLGKGGGVDAVGDGEVLGGGRNGFVW
jgi:hypothetical protein